MIIDYSKYIPGDKLIMTVGPEIVELIYCNDGLFRDSNETIYGFCNSSDSTDSKVRLGVGAFSLPSDVPINDAAICHDNEYSNPAYQAVHDRSEADLLLKKQIEELGKNSLWGLLATPFYWIVRSMGGKYWENEKTNK